jgi:pimeloyl-ACP methyl ester carboxylesterase
LSELSPEELVETLLPTMFSHSVPPGMVAASRASMLGFHPVGLRAMARASAENLRGVLPHVKVPTLLVYGDRDVRAPLAVAEDLNAAIAGSTLVVLAGVGHACNLEAPEEFNRVVRAFLRDRRS